MCKRRERGRKSHKKLNKARPAKPLEQEKKLRPTRIRELKMKQVVLMIFGVVLTLHSYAQTPTNYRLTIDWSNRDMNGKVLLHRIASGKIVEISRQSFIENTTQLEDWSLTEMSEQGRNTRQIEELDGLKLEISRDNFTNLDFYKDFPPAQVELIRWIVQDKVAFGVYGQMYLDSLQLNVPYYPDFFQNQQADFEQYVNFNTQKLNITWLGFSEMNGKNCKLVYYKSMYNPINADNDIMILNGRSCFWGHIWISPDTRQIEYATMNEDLIYKMKLKSNDFEQQINMQRDLIFRKIE